MIKMSELNFKGLNALLLARAGEFLMQWLPGGRIIGHDYVCGDLHGGPGNSLKFNMRKGIGSDFATGETFGDLIDLYSKIEGIAMGDAYKRLSEQVGFKSNPTPSPHKPPIEHQISRPPTDIPLPDMKHSKWGYPCSFWRYQDADGLLFIVARYETEEGKQFLPWSWSSNAGKWVAKGWTAPRPLYGLDKLTQRPGAPVLICEGEKAADAAETMAGEVYVCVSWPNGAKGVEKADWKTLCGRKVLIWPDADLKVAETDGQAFKYGIKKGDFLPYIDQPGSNAANKIASILLPKCPEVKIINVGVEPDRPDGWDAADALADGWGWDQVLSWAKPRAVIVAQAVAQVTAKSGPSVATATAQVNVTVNTGEEEGGSANKYALWESLGLITNGQGNPHVNVDNAVRVLEFYEPLKNIIWFDEFHQKYFTGDPAREWKNVDTLNLTTYMQRVIGLSKLSDEMIYKACVIYGHKRIRNEPRDWMESLVWDKTERIAWFLHEAFGASEESEYVWAASKNFWIGMVARILQPGCKMDNMLVLEGQQGTYKSTALNIIGGSWYTETRGSVLEKDFFLNLHGKLIVEIAELSAFRKAEITAIKQVISCRTDRYRAPYDRTSEDHPRQSVFVGTTNEGTYLSDNTGGRRFWPVVCGEINLDYAKENRDQLFAEAVALYKSGATWYEMPRMETERVQEIRRHVDEWETVIDIWLERRNETSIGEITGDCLRIEIGKLDMGSTRRVGGILRRLGWLKGEKNLWVRAVPIESDQGNLKLE